METPFDGEFRAPELPMFEESVADDVHALAYVGYLEDEFRHFGHRFVMRTLPVSDEMELGMLLKRYANTVMQAKALATGTVAASLFMVDGKLMPQPLGSDDMEAIGLKLDVVKAWHWPLIELLYNDYLTLQVRAFEALDEFQSKSARGPQKSSPYADSLTDKESSRGED